MSSRDCCKDGTSRPDFDPKRNFMGQPWLDHEDSTPPLSYLDQASAAPLFGHAPAAPGGRRRGRRAGVAWDPPRLLDGGMVRIWVSLGMAWRPKTERRL